MISNEIMLKVENVSKVYRLGEIGGTTLRDELQRLSARFKGKEDPTKRIGSKKINKGERFKALDNISFEVKKGERIGIIGHNGAGKSTLLKLISRVTGPTEGAIFLNGRVASMLEVGTGFHPELTGRENIYMNGAILGMTKKEIDSKMEDIIEFSEVRQFIDTPVKRYSSGMYVKLAFSVSAHLDSEIMIMDEVLAVGDMQFQNKCISKMKSVSENEDRTILYVSHNMNTIKELCNRIIVLDHGKISFDGGVSEGIARYLGLKGSQTVYNYTPNDHSPAKKSYVTINKFEVCDCKRRYLKPGESFSGRIYLDSERVFEGIRIRFELMDETSHKIGTCLSNNIQINKGENIINVVIPTTNLVRGRYSADIVIYEFNNNGFENLLDGIYRGIIFDISDDLSDFNNLNWKKERWGSVHLPDAKIDLEK